MRFISLFHYVKDLSTPLFSAASCTISSFIYPSIIYAIGTNLCPIKGSIYWTQLYAKMTNLCTKVKKEKNAKKG